MNNTEKPTFVIVGGGTAGWMSASLLHHHLAAHGFHIRLIESPDIPIIGVGEGSTPHLKQFFNNLGIAESEWMPACQATYKTGISFYNWSSRPGFGQYFHPFPSLPDRDTARGFLLNCHARRQGQNVHAHPDAFFLSAYLAEHRLSPLLSNDQPIAIGYGYHFDSALLGNYLAQRAIGKGVEHIQAEVKEVRSHANGQIKSVVTDRGEEISGDHFIDCSGFASLLLQLHLGTGFKPFKDNLFNNAAVAIPSAHNAPLQSQTRSTALKYGWAWDIPLLHRIGNGYVYSSDYCSPEQAEQELREKIGDLAGDQPARHIKMKVGRVEQHWQQNCLAVGLSQGFIEPLEATALHLVQDTLENFISAFSAGGFSNQHQAEFNQMINARFDGIRDYIVCHYKVNSRQDTDYWCDNRENPHLSDSLSHILDVWDKGGDLTAEIERQGIGAYYPSVSWQCLLAGYGRFRDTDQPAVAQPQVDMEKIRAIIQRLAKAFVPQQSLLELQR